MQFYYLIISWDVVELRIWLFQYVIISFKNCYLRLLSHYAFGSGLASSNNLQCQFLDRFARLFKFYSFWSTGSEREIVRLISIVCVLSKLHNISKYLQNITYIFIYLGVVQVKNSWTISLYSPRILYNTSVYVTLWKLMK